MPKGGHGRGVIAAIGLLLLFAGLLGGVVLWIFADREPESAAESFARAAPGCTTTLTFGEAGEFYVFEELSGVARPIDGCQPSTLAGRPFTFTVVARNGSEVPRVADDSVSYDLDVGEGTSVARITIPEAGEYRISVLGDDPAVVAAVGGDPAADVERLRMGAIAAAAAGVVLGGLMLWLSGRRSKRAATFASPIDPGWGVTERDHARRANEDGSMWPPESPDVRRVPVNPHAPDERRVAEPWSVAPAAGEPPTADDPADARAAPPAGAWPSDLDTPTLPDDRADDDTGRDDAGAASSEDDETPA